MSKDPRKGVYDYFTEEELRDAYANMTIFSDAVANAFFSDIFTTQHIIRAVIEQDDLTVTEVKTQTCIDNALGHSVRFDVFAKDTEGNYYDIEIQNNSTDDLPMRADFYGAAIKMRYFQKLKSYSEIPRICVIFFVKDGRFCNNQLVNHYVIKDDLNRDLGFGTRIYFVNGSLHDNSPVGKISHDFSCQSADEMLDQVVAKQFKSIQPRRKDKMDSFMQEVFRRGEMSGEMRGEMRGEERGEKRGEKRGVEKGARDKALDIAKNMRAMKLSDDIVAKATGLSLDQVQSLPLQ